MHSVIALVNDRVKSQIKWADSESILISALLAMTQNCGGPDPDHYSEGSPGSSIGLSPLSLEQPRSFFASCFLFL